MITLIVTNKRLLDLSLILSPTWSLDPESSILEVRYVGLCGIQAHANFGISTNLPNYF